MKNKTYKNLIVLGAIAIFVAGFNYSFAYSNPAFRESTIDLNASPLSNPNFYGNTSSIYNNYVVPQPEKQYNYVAPNTQQQYNYVQQQPYTYIEQPTKYVAQPVTTNYVPQQNVQYVNTGSSQGASVINATTANSKSITNKNTGTTGNSGQYVSYDGYNAMGASAYGYNNGQQATVTPVAVDNNGVTALSVKGSGSFMPSSVFQWLMLIVLILAIIIVARMVAKKSANAAHAPAH